jgi:hypothetical protein
MDEQQRKAELDAWVKATVDAAPPLTHDQKVKLAALLGSRLRELREPPP